MTEEIKFAFIEDGKFMVFEDGRIFKRLDPPVSSGGYKFVRIGAKSYPLHRVIASAFIPNPENKPEVNHIDCNKANNAVSNLEWVTRKENARHAAEHGLLGTNKVRDRSESQRIRRRLEADRKATEKAKEENTKKKYSRELIDKETNKIKKCRLKSGLSQTELAFALGVDQSAVSNWERGKAEPTAFNIRRLADLLGVKPGDLF